MNENAVEPVEAQLERVLAEAEKTVVALRKELEEVRSRRVRDEEIAAQHEEINRLSEYLAEAQVHWSAVREFFESALSDLTTRNDDQQDDSEARS